MRTLLIVLVLCATSPAGIIREYVPGNDNSVIVSEIVGHDVEIVGKFDDFTFEPVSWSETGSAIPNDLNLFDTSSGELLGDVDYDYFTVKAGNSFHLYENDGLVTPWTTPFGKDVSHITLYRHMPEPGVHVLGLLPLLAWRRKCQRR